MLLGLRRSAPIKATGQLWSQLKALGINRVTKRGTRAGRKLIRPISVINKPRLAARTIQQQHGVNTANIIQCYAPTSPKLKPIPVHITNSCNTPCNDVVSETKLGESSSINIQLQARCTAKISSHVSNFGLLNARSAKQKDGTADKPSEIHDLISDNDLDILVITETWLRGDTTDSVAVGDMTPNGYCFVHAPRMEGRGGGLAVIHKSNIKMTKFHRFTFKTFECFSISANISGVSLKLCALYKPPKFAASSQFLEEFSSLVEQLTSSPGELILLGDFNLHVDIPSNHDATKFLNILESTNLLQHVNLPTHQNGHTLDLVITRSTGLGVHGIGTNSSVSSDHLTVTFSVAIPKPQKSTKSMYLRKWKSINTDNLNNDIKSSILAENSTTEVNQSVQLYNQVLRELIDKHAPGKQTTITIRPQTPWYNADIKQAKQLCRKLERQWRTSGLTVHRDMFKAQRNTLHQLREKAKSTFFTDKIESASNPREVYKVMNTLLHKDTDPVLPAHSSARDLAEKFAHFFTEKVTAIRNGIELPTLPAQDEALSIELHTEITSFRPATEEEIDKLVISSPSKSSSLDPIPTWLLKTCRDALVPILTHIVNLSLSSGTMPTHLKDAVISPILKKSSLDKDVLKNYRPVSNLSFVSKLCERVVAARFLEHLDDNNISNPFQSAYKKQHSTETALLRVHNDIMKAVDSHGAAILVLLDLSAAFDTIDHQLLLRTLHKLGIRGSAHTWFKSYLTERHQSVLVKGCKSSKQELLYGVPQGSVLGPLLFTTYTMSLSNIISSNGVDHEMYADDNSLYAAFTPASPSNKAATIDCIEKVVDVIKVWMDSHFLKLNQEKTEILVISSKSQLARAAIPSLNICGCEVQPSRTVRSLGVTFDPVFSFESHIKNVCRSIFHQIYTISRIRKYLTEDAIRTLVNANITSRLDYCNSLLVGIPASLRNRLQHAQNAAARLISRTRKYEHITPVLKQLHWLPVEFRIQYKVMLLTYKSMNGLAPQYLVELIQPYTPGRSLRSQDQSLLQEQKFRLKSYGYRAFQHQGPMLWNSLPLAVRKTNTLGSFKASLKTHLFKLAFN